MTRLFRRIPKTLAHGRIRTTTALLVVAWLGLFVLYGWTTERYRSAEPATSRPVPVVTTTTPPPSTPTTTSAPTTTTSPRTTSTPSTSTTTPTTTTGPQQPNDEPPDTEGRQTPTTNTPTESRGGYTGFP